MKIIIKNKEKEKIFCTLDSVKSDSLTIIIPGEGENRNKRAYRIISKKFNSIGIDTLRCDLSAMGESEGKPEENRLTKRVKDILSVIDKIKPKYDNIYFLGFSFGALAGLIASTKIKFRKQFILSAALFAEKRGIDYKFLKAWKKMGTLPDWNSFKKGFIKPAKQKLNYDFVTDLKRYNLKKVSDKVKSETILICGGEEYPIMKQKYSQEKDFYKVPFVLLSGDFAESFSLDHFPNSRYLSKNLSLDKVISIFKEILVLCQQPKALSR